MAETSTFRTSKSDLHGGVKPIKELVKTCLNKKTETKTTPLEYTSTSHVPARVDIFGEPARSTHRRWKKRFLSLISIVD